MKIAALIVILIIAAVSVFAALTYPRTTLNFPVSFDVGAKNERKEFIVPMLHGWVQVQVVVSSGTALWAAGILSEDSELWSHRAAQGGQTTYNSGWMQMTSGNYNFTFAAVGFGTLAAEITVSSKGGIWQKQNGSPITYCTEGINEGTGLNPARYTIAHANGHFAKISILAS